MALSPAASQTSVGTVDPYFARGALRPCTEMMDHEQVLDWCGFAGGVVNTVHEQGRYKIVGIKFHRGSSPENYGNGGDSGGLRTVLVRFC